MREHGGDLRLKFRLKPDGLMFGWDVDHRPGVEKYSADEIERRGLYFPAGYTSIGGDFKEARPAVYHWNGRSFDELPEEMRIPLNPRDQAILDKYHLMLIDTPPLGAPTKMRTVWEQGWYIGKDGRKVYVDY
jgi:hypothetical protein